MLVMGNGFLFMRSTMADERISVDRIDHLMRLAFEELKSRGGRARPKDILPAVEAALDSLTTSAPGQKREPFAGRPTFGSTRQIA